MPNARIDIFSAGLLAIALQACAPQPLTVPPARLETATAEPSLPEDAPLPGPKPSADEEPPAPTSSGTAVEDPPQAHFGHGPRDRPTTAEGPGADEAALRGQFGGRRPLRRLRGRATVYHDSLAGNRTASGGWYEPGAFTAAHRTLPFGTVLRIRRAGDQADVYVRVTDRGPFGSPKLILDLSRAAAERIDLLRRGVAEVEVDVLRLGDGGAR